MLLAGQCDPDQLTRIETLLAAILAQLSCNDATNLLADAVATLRAGTNTLATLTADEAGHTATLASLANRFNIP